MNIRRWILPLTWSFILVVPGCRQAPPPKASIRPVRAIKLAHSTGLDGHVFSGRAEATQEVNIAFEVQGKLNERPVNVGDEVPAGQLLARLDPRDYQNNLDAATARMEQAQAYRERIAEAAKTGAVSQQELTDAEARLDVTKAEVKIAAKALDDAEIRAPFAGIIVATYVENFQNVRAKEAVLRLLDTSKIEMWVDIPEHLISQAAYVKEITVIFDAFPDQPVPATIKEIGSEATERTRTYPVNLIMDQPEGIKILPGMAGAARGRVEVPGEEAGLEVPMSAIFADQNEQSCVWVIDESSKTVGRRQVELGALTPRGAKVKGLQPGDWIATAGVHTLKEGQQVTILNEAALFARGQE
jgi:RND family efflux transporter MFP subunit